MSVLSDIVDEIATVMADPTVRFAFGRLELDEHGTMPAICAVPVGGPLTMTESPGRHDVGAVAVRELFLRNVRVDWYCWGADAGAAEDLMTALIVAVESSRVQGSYFPDSETWMNQAAGGAAWQNQGECVMLSMTLQIPVVDGPKQLTKPLVRTHQGTLNGGEGCD